MASFIRKVPTASGGTAVQVVHKQGRQVVGIEHIGSAHDDARLAALMEIARRQLRPGQDVLDLGPAPESAAGTVPTARSGARVVGMASTVLWDVLGRGYADLGFDQVKDATFAKLVLARIVEPTSKADTIRVLDELGVKAPSLRTVFNCLARCTERDYRQVEAPQVFGRCYAGCGSRLRVA